LIKLIEKRVDACLFVAAQIRRDVLIYRNKLALRFPKQKNLVSVLFQALSIAVTTFLPVAFLISFSISLYTFSLHRIVVEPPISFAAIVAFATVITILQKALYKIYYAFWHLLAFLNSIAKIWMTNLYCKRKDLFDNTKKTSVRVNARRVFCISLLLLLFQFPFVLIINVLFIQRWTLYEGFLDNAWIALNWIAIFLFFGALILNFVIPILLTIFSDLLRYRSEKSVLLLSKILFIANIYFAIALPSTGSDYLLTLGLGGGHPAILQYSSSSQCSTTKSVLITIRTNEHVFFIEDLLQNKKLETTSLMNNMTEPISIDNVKFYEVSNSQICSITYLPPSMDRVLL
jgi:hypothetical protein